MAAAWRDALRAVQARDPGWSSLRRAARVAIVVPSLAAVAGRVAGSADATTFAVFGGLALLGLADFGGPTLPRARAYAVATAAGAALVALGTVASANPWTAVTGTVLVSFVVLFIGVFGGYIAAAQTAMLLAFIVAVSLPAPVAATAPRLAGWTLAGCAALATGVLLWPRHARTQVRERAAEASRALALAVDPGAAPATRDRARDRVDAARQAYDQAQIRPAGPARRDRALVDLVIGLGRVLDLAGRAAGQDSPAAPAERRELIGRTKEVLVASADVLTGGDRPELTALDQARTAHRDALEGRAAARLRADDPAESVLDDLRAGGELRVLAHATLAVAADAMVVAGYSVEDAPDPLPSWTAPRPGFGPWLARVAEALRTHLRPSSVWFVNSVRAALALGLAVLVTRIARPEHSFWVVLGTLSVLRSNALATGRTAALAIIGTIAGVIVAAGLTVLIGTSTVGLWVTLPIAAFLAGYAVTAPSFLVGQAAFTLFVIVLFDLLQPQGWQIGLIRLENVAVGVGVSLIVAVLLWPRGARGRLRTALAAQYRADAACLDAAFGYLLGDRDAGQVDVCRRVARYEAGRAGEAFDVFLTERGSRTVPTRTWGRVAEAGNGVLLAVDALEAVGLLGYRATGCAESAGRVRRNVAAVVGAFVGFAAALGEEGRGPPAAHAAEAVTDTRDAVVGCLRAWHGAPVSATGRTALGMAAAWFWSVETARLADQLAGPITEVAAAARAPWWR